MTNSELQQYLNVVIPNIERELSSGEVEGEELIGLYNLYDDVLCLVAPHDFATFNKYLEFDEDKTQENKGFYYHREEAIGEIIEALNDMEVYDKYDILLISMPPRIGKTTTGIRFLSWIIGRHPERTQLATSYSDNITMSFYNGVLEVIGTERYQKVFPDAPLVDKNAKREEIWLKAQRRYPSISFVSISGSMTGRAEAGNYLYCDDLVSGIEEALSRPRLDSLWQKYTDNARQRKMDGCKEIHIATPWSLHDPISKLKALHADNPRCKIISKSCYDENGESNFKFKGGFSTEYYKDLENTMDSASFSAIYKQEPIEREGILYHEDDLMYYFERPDERPDAIVAVVDSKNLGKDNVACPIGYYHNGFVYIDDVVYNSGLPGVTKELVSNKLVEHNVTRCDVEMNNGGNYYAEGLEEKIKEKNGVTSFRIFFSGNNKDVKIVSFSDYVKKHFIFKHKSQYSPNSEYAKFMADVLKWTQTGKNAFDDAPDSLAMLAQLIQDMEGNSIVILNRKEIGV